MQRFVAACYHTHTDRIAPSKWNARLDSTVYCCQRNVFEFRSGAVDVTLLVPEQTTFRRYLKRHTTARFAHGRSSQRKG